MADCEIMSEMCGSFRFKQCDENNLRLFSSTRQQNCRSKGVLPDAFSHRSILNIMRKLGQTASRLFDYTELTTCDCAVSFQITRERFRTQKLRTLDPPNRL